MIIAIFRLHDDSFHVDVVEKEELCTVAKLLGISSTILWQGLTTRTHNVRGQLVKSMSDANLVRANFCVAFYRQIIHLC